MRRVLGIAVVVAAGCGDDGAALVDAALTDALGDATGERPTLLSQTGLYVPGTRDIASGNERFEPSHALWSDGALKRRWIALPAGTTIDTADVDHWRFPVGTRFWKEFAAPDGTLLETRLIERIASTGDLEQDYWLGAFVWRADGSDADFAVDGATNVNGTQHDVPAQKRCPTCHRGEPGMILGFATQQLSGPGEGLRLADLTARLSTAVGTAPAPGDAAAAAALGYLHANCGHCHNPSGSAWPDASMDLRLYVADATPEQTAAYRTAVGQPLTRFQHADYALRIAPGDPGASAVVYRMSTRGTPDQMPPIATEVIDLDGAVAAWIAGM